MIFQALINLNERLAQNNKVPPFGFSEEEIGFVITLDSQGRMIGEPEDLRRKIAPQKYEYRSSYVPYSNEVNVRSSNAATTPNFLVDKADYIFGMSGKATKTKYRDSYLKLFNEVSQDSTDEGIIAVKKFLETWNPEDSPSLPLWKEISGTHGKWIAFRLEGDTNFVHERPAVKELWLRFLKNKQYPRGISFVDGQEYEIQEQYAQFKFGGTGASLVSFNDNAYESYCKKRGENAPIGILQEFKASTALKYLLRHGYNLKVGDVTTVYWAEKTTPFETVFSVVLDSSVEIASASKPVEKFLRAVKKGKISEDISNDKEIKFYILGLSLNKARLAVRFWFVSTVEEMVKRFHDHFHCLEIEQNSEQEIPLPGIKQLIRETARESKNVSPLLGGALLRSILSGHNYPQHLYQGVLTRIKAEQNKKNQRTGKSIPNVNYFRAAILKAVLVRNFRKEVPMSLDDSRTDIGYLLGRLFAILEKAQTDALGNVNTTIKDRFFGAASTTPASIFPTLLRLTQHHVEKAKYGFFLDKRIAEVVELIDRLPTHLSLQEQGLFSIGYYHQKNAIEREIKEAMANKQANT